MRLEKISSVVVHGKPSRLVAHHVQRFESIVHRFESAPIGVILEFSDIQDQYHIPFGIESSDRAVVTRTCLSKCLSVEIGREE
jgi:hypothetical protein